MENTKNAQDNTSTTNTADNTTELPSNAEQLDVPGGLHAWQEEKLTENDQDVIEAQLVLNVIPIGLTGKQAAILLNLTFNYTQQETAKNVKVSRVYVKDIAYKFKNELAELRSRKKIVLKAFSESNLYRAMKLLSDSLALAKPCGKIGSIQQLSNALNTLMLTHERLALTDMQTRGKMIKREGQKITAKTLKAIDELPK